MSLQKNVLGTTLRTCCKNPMTGFFRNGLCETDEEDQGSHTVCIVATEEFLRFSKSVGNDLSTPMLEFGFPGIKAGDCWCLCLTRWKQAYDEGKAPKVKLESCHRSALNLVPLETLKKYSVLVIAVFGMSLTTEAAAEAKKFDLNSLTNLQKEVTQNGGTEAPFKNPYWNHYETGIYVDVVSGEPLFSSLDKYDSGTGWPSFKAPIMRDNVVMKKEKSLFGDGRNEVRSKSGNSHLGHVFDDGPGPEGKRFCMNSAALRFVPLKELEKQGYGEFLPLFNKKDAQPNISHLYLKKDAPKPLPKIEFASFAAGCFWGVEQEFRKQNGVIATAVGFMGGKTISPTYDQVSDKGTGHAETVQIAYDPKVISYTALLDIFWHLHDPTTLNRQGPDTGDQYRSAIFFSSPEQKKLAIATRDEIQKSGELDQKIVTEITAAKEFWKADEYHQQYVEKGGRAGCHIRRKAKK